MADISAFEKYIAGLANDEGFLRTLTDDILSGLPDNAAKQGVVKAAVRCIFGGPRGVRTMVETKNHSHIKNNKNWRPFCMSVLKFIREKIPDEFGKLEKNSSMYSSYGKCWPECNEQLEADVEKARKAMQGK